ncbi:hypothetical protein [Microbacterium sp. CPCC 204701]|uniref:hypothetical protein n=1 Tax=Microbacterium sp. CPCC 204701 TaxID=2493084 RepID=UPI000FD86342|nr:hypothetical protein [Microbacterium sp. CPCC 204701]
MGSIATPYAVESGAPNHERVLSRAERRTASGEYPQRKILLDAVAAALGAGLILWSASLAAESGGLIPFQVDVAGLLMVMGVVYADRGTNVPFDLDLGHTRFSIPQLTSTTHTVAHE